MRVRLGGTGQNFLNLVSEDVELKFIDLQLGCAYMYVCCKRGRTLSGTNSLKKIKDIIHE
jgi:hypothetical protein